MRESVKRNREYYIFNSIPIILKDNLESEEVSIEDFVQNIEEKIPQHLLQNVEMVYIGDFPALSDRNALYADGAIYITNTEPTTYDMLENMIHEIAHSIEETYGRAIYGDSKLKSEFLGKRQKLQSILDSRGYKFPAKYYLNTEYSQRFDEFLSDDVGYPTLLGLTMGLFVSPYGATSLKEYFANGFEKYFLGEVKLVKEVSPILYNILNTLYTESNN